MSDECKKLHEILSKLKKYKFPLNEREIPQSGVYILFEKNELGHDTDRIVRIGTHNGDDRLFLRLNEHFMVENKDSVNGKIESTKIENKNRHF